jgi:glycosyltransferase involved in cell wall biosynthesis
MTQRVKAGRLAVSVTPLALEADSRTFRVACELAAVGFRSIVLEGRASRHRFWDYTIEVRSLASPRLQTSGSLPHRGGALRSGRFGGCGEFALYTAFRSHDWVRHWLQPLIAIPKADLYYIHSFELHRAVLARAAGVPIIYDAHDFYRGIEPPALQRSFDQNWLRPFFDRLESRVVASADAVVTVSDGVAGLIEKAFGRRPVVIRNCHDERLDRPTASDLRQTLGLAPTDCLCVVVGNWKPGMAVEVAVDALAHLPDRFHLVFLGRGYEKVARKLPPDLLGRRLHIGHVLAPNEVVPSIRSADVGLMIYKPYSENYRYALPNGFFQIVAAGLPIVRAPLPEIEATIGHRPVGVCLARLDPVTLAQAIVRCADEAQPHRANAAALARDLRWEIEAARLSRIIDGLFAGRTSSASDHLGVPKYRISR